MRENLETEIENHDILYSKEVSHLSRLETHEGGSPQGAIASSRTPITTPGFPFPFRVP